ncbi:MAG: tRNA-(ms[2]io[6]A)-hydroxylase [Bacteroidetes bacterium]|jgi:tRNA 2-(methylsulfanyl)-N6-isopentenyladenosine37 hydroxylase|nr:tRNA-(ms[2]io[6]A)-hydroxylase [Bacteroidota bacterium]
MLGLKMATDPRWVNIAEKTIEEILVDHAFCEQKAATSGISLIVRFSNYPNIVEKVSPVVAEEWGHFRKVLKELKTRGYELGKPRKDDYVHELQKFSLKGGSIKTHIVEALLICAMIEARSCERFRLLSLHISDQSLKDFYHEFMVSEAGHYRMFIDLANEFADKAYVQERWNAYLDFEADLVTRLEYRGDRVH